MRIGVVVEPVTNGTAFDDLRAQVRAADAAGLDACAVSAGADDWSATTVAAALSRCSATMRMIVQLRLGDHPVEIAEELIVADLCLNGRLTVVVDADGCDDVLHESLDLLLASLTPLPFRHEGPRWTVPATDGWLLTVTPSPAQLELPIHVLGADRAAVALSHGVPPVMRRGDTGSTATALWTELAGQTAAARHRWRRIAQRDLSTDRSSGLPDSDATVTALRVEQRGWGLDTCLFHLPDGASLPHRLAAIEALGAEVRPRVQLESLPAGVEQMWADARRAATSDHTERP